MSGSVWSELSRIFDGIDQCRVGVPKNMAPLTTAKLLSCRRIWVGEDFSRPPLDATTQLQPLGRSCTRLRKAIRSVDSGGSSVDSTPQASEKRVPREGRPTLVPVLRRPNLAQSCPASAEVGQISPIWARTLPSLTKSCQLWSTPRRNWNILIEIGRTLGNIGQIGHDLAKVCPNWVLILPKSVNMGKVRIDQSSHVQRYSEKNRFQRFARDLPGCRCITCLCVRVSGAAWARPSQLGDVKCRVLPGFVPIRAVRGQFRPKQKAKKGACMGYVPHLLPAWQEHNCPKMDTHGQNRHAMVFPGAYSGRKSVPSAWRNKTDLAIAIPGLAGPQSTHTVFSGNPFKSGNHGHVDMCSPHFANQILV